VTNWLSETFHQIIEKAGYVGAVLVVLVLVLWGAAYYRLIPKLSRRTASILAVGALFLIFCALWLPTVEPVVKTFERLVLRVRTIDVMLENEEGHTVLEGFTVVYRTPDQGVERAEQHNGAAAIRGLPVGLENLDVVGIECPGWSIREKGPFSILDGKVTVPMQKNAPKPPPDDKKRPDPSVFLPTDEQLRHEPKFKPEEVVDFGALQLLGGRCR
jgi:hypothetical protein